MQATLEGLETQLEAERSAQAEKERRLAELRAGTCVHHCTHTYIAVQRALRCIPRAFIFPDTVELQIKEAKLRMQLSEHNVQARSGLPSALSTCCTRTTGGAAPVREARCAAPRHALRAGRSTRSCLG